MKTWVFLFDFARVDELLEWENPLSLFEKTQDWVFCLKRSEICSTTEVCLIIERVILSENSAIKLNKRFKI
jgi:hypothetical protein